MIELRSDGVEAAVLDDVGARLGSLRVGGTELLVTRPAEDPLMWGGYPMAPYAGRVRDARFDHDGETVRLPASLPPHAGHGLVYDRAWRRVDDGADPSRCALTIDLGDDWPFGGHAEHRVDVTAAALRCTLAVVAGERSMPAEVGWHPWFRSRGPIALHATAMYERDGVLPTGRLVDPAPPPWDDCFVTTDPVEFPVDDLGVSVRSDCDHVVVFTEMERGIAVEPQSGPPDAVHIRPRVLEPGERLQRTMTIAWRSTVDTGR